MSSWLQKGMTVQISKYVGSCLWVSKLSVSPQMSDCPLSYMTAGGRCNIHQATQITPLSFMLHNSSKILENKTCLMIMNLFLLCAFFCSPFFIVIVCLNFVRFVFCDGFPQEDGKWIHNSLVWKRKNLLSKSKYLRATSAWTDLTFYLITVPNVRTLALHKGTWTMFVWGFIQHGELTPEPW